MKQYKNAYRRDICDILGKIKSQNNLQLLFKLSVALAHWDEMSRADVERILIVIKLFDEAGLDEKELKLVNMFVRSLSRNKNKRGDIK